MGMFTITNARVPLRWSRAGRKPVRPASGRPSYDAFFADPDAVEADYRRFRGDRQPRLTAAGRFIGELSIR